MKKEKIEYNVAPLHTPELNGTAERFNKTLQNKIRALMIDSGLPESMWILGVEAAVHIYNRTSYKSLNSETSINKLTPKVKTHLEQIRRFGCIAYAKILITERKFSERAIKAIMVGYSQTGYVLWHPSAGKFLHSRHVRCNEKLVYRDIYNQKPEQNNKSEETEESKDPEKEIAPLYSEEKETQAKEIQENKPEEKQSKKKQKDERPKKKKAEDKKPDNPEADKRKQPRRNAKTTENREKYMAIRRTQTTKQLEDTSLRLNNKGTTSNLETTSDRNNSEDEIRHAFIATINKDSTTYSEAMESKEKNRWLEAINDEIKSMEENRVWQFVDIPSTTKDGKKVHIIDSKWVFKKKTGEKGENVFKGRLVIRGFKDRNVYELKETYVPVSRLAIIRAALAIINKYDLEVFQMDVKTAFLNGILEEEIYMEIPDGINCDAETRRTKVCKLQKALYDLRISPKR